MVRVQVMGVALNSLFIGGECLFVPLEAAQHIPCGFIWLCILWIEPDRPVVSFERLVIARQFAEYFSPLRVSGGVLRRKTNCLIVDSQCSFVPLKLAEQFSFFFVGV